VKTTPAREGEDRFDDDATGSDDTSLKLFQMGCSEDNQWSAIILTRRQRRFEESAV
jgi:hypothetical protein